ncbi:MAG TPA: RluA family pseudouridine synthase [Cyclobacteriaceae bacterium]|nr:RluA family pseudouridine synthase [Cyclobacteriaceae bacterium]
MKPFTVIHEDNHLLVVNKASGVLVQGDVTGDTPLVELCKQYIAEKYDKPGAVFLGVVHRLDRPVSGVVVFARTSKALERMNKLFREKETVKTYVAMVRNKPSREEDTLIHWLKKDEKKNRTTAFTREMDQALRSELKYKVIGRFDHCWVLQVNPVTGRPHQIRVQLAGIGCPIMGDVKYGDDEPNSNGSIYLHARRLSFIHPVKKENASFEAPFPEYERWGLLTRISI